MHGEIGTFSNLASTRRRRILIVDDLPTNIQLLYEIVRADNEVYMATDGQQALNICAEVLPDLILLDVMMPGISGLEVCRRLRSDSRTADIPVIVVTAQDSAGDEVRALEAGAVDFITKPVNPPVVRARVNTQLTLKAQADLLKKLALIDGLTGVANRGTFDRALEAEWRHCRRNARPLALLMVDVDHFKFYNDQYGHMSGDTCLRRIAATLQESFGRPHDLVARYGGEEFVCLLPETDINGAQSKAEDCCRSIADLQIPHQASPVAAVVTVSIGVAALMPEIGVPALNILNRADQALYAAKADGRNRVCSEICA